MRFYIFYFRKVFISYRFCICSFSLVLSVGTFSIHMPALLYCNICHLFFIFILFLQVSFSSLLSIFELFFLNNFCFTFHKWCLEIHCLLQVLNFFISFSYSISFLILYHFLKAFKSMVTKLTKTKGRMEKSNCCR